MDKPAPRFRHEDVKALRNAPSNNYFPPYPPLFITKEVESLKDLEHNFYSYKSHCLRALGGIYLEDMKFVIDYITTTLDFNNKILKDNQRIITLSDDTRHEVIRDVESRMIEYNKIREWIRKFSRLERELNEEETEIADTCISYMSDHWTRDSFDLITALKELKDPSFSGREDLIRRVKETPGLSDEAKDHITTLLR